MSLQQQEKSISALLQKLPLLKQEIQKIIVEQDEVLEEIIIAMLAGGIAY